MNWKYILISVLYVLIGSGIGTFIAQKLFEHRLNKKLYRFSKLYSDKVDAIRELYRLLVKTERALYLFMSQREPSDQETRIEFNSKTVDVINEFVHYFNENEILFEENSIVLINQIIDKIDRSKSVQFMAALLESDRGSNAWADAISEKQSILDNTIKSEIPKLKERLKSDFQDKYHLLSN